MLPSILSKVLLAAAGLSVGSDPGPRELLAQRTDSAASIRVVSQLEAGFARNPGDLDWAEALLRARKFVADEDGNESRAGRFHERNIDDGLAVLSAELDQRIDDFGGLCQLLPEVDASLVGVLFWTTLSFGRTIRDRSVFSRPAAARNFRQALSRLVELDEGYFFGGPLRAAALYDMSAPGIMGGSDDRAVRLALDAMQRAPRFAPNRLVLAKIALERERSDNRVIRLLEGALEEWPGLSAVDAPEHHRARDRAAEILAELR